jgi:hypothetical protein
VTSCIHILPGQRWRQRRSCNRRMPVFVLFPSEAIGGDTGNNIGCPNSVSPRRSGDPNIGNI